MEFLIFLVFGFLSSLVGEYVGRSKHIGKGWSTVLLLCGIVPGIIALLASPKATAAPTTGKGYNIFGWILVVFGIGGIVLTFIDHSTYQNYSGYSSNYNTQQFGIRLIINIGIILVGVYLIQLGKGQIVNKNPKYYFQNSKWSSPLSNSINHSKVFTAKRASNLENHLYFIAEKNKKVGPFSYDELAQKRISENTLVWRNGLDNWIPANQLNEISAVVVFNPPPLPKKTNVITNGLDKLTTDEKIEVQTDDKKNVKKEVVVEGSEWVSIMLEKYETQTIDIGFNKNELIKNLVVFCLAFMFFAFGTFSADKISIGERVFYIVILIFLGLVILGLFTEFKNLKNKRLIILNSSIQFWENGMMVIDVPVSDFVLTTKCDKLSEIKLVTTAEGFLTTNPERAWEYIDKIKFTIIKDSSEKDLDDYFCEEFSKDFYNNARDSMAIVYAQNKSA